MELRHIYTLSNKINEVFSSEEMVGGDISDINIKVEVSQSTLYGIDIEFYRQTHNGSTEGFEHKEEIDAMIDGIHFTIVGKR